MQHMSKPKLSKQVSINKTIIKPIPQGQKKRMTTVGSVDKLVQPMLKSISDQNLAKLRAKVLKPSITKALKLAKTRIDSTSNQSRQNSSTSR